MPADTRWHAVILVWLVTGPLFRFSNTWQLAVNTGTTIVTFLMVFLIQHTQNRDSAAMQLKLDEIIRSIDGAQDALLDLEELEPGELEQIRSKYEELARLARGDLRVGNPVGLEFEPSQFTHTRAFPPGRALPPGRTELFRRGD